MDSRSFPKSQTTMAIPRFTYLAYQFGQLRIEDMAWPEIVPTITLWKDARVPIWVGIERPFARKMVPFCDEIFSIGMGQEYIEIAVR